MKRRTLQPEQIIVPGEYELGNESILKIYFRIFDKGYGDCLPPVIVIGLGDDKDKLISWLENVLSSEHLTKYQKYVEARRKDYQTLFSILKESPYMLVDGNHRSAAATLTSQPISTMELQTDKDFERINKMIKAGDLFDFKRGENSPYNLKRSFLAYCLYLNPVRDDGNFIIPLSNTSVLRYTKTIKQRIDELTSNGDLPQYMKDRYLRCR